MRRSRRRIWWRRCAVLFDERVEPFEAVRAGGRRVDVGVDAFEAAQPALDLALRVELVADLGGEFRDLVPDVVQSQCAGRYQGTAVLEHSLDLGDQRVVDLQRLGGPERRLGLQCPRRGDRVDGVGLVQAPRAALGCRARRRDLAGVEPRRCERDRDMLSPLRRPLWRPRKSTGQTICRDRVVEGGVEPLSVVAAQPGEDLPPSLGAGGEAAPVGEFSFQAREERLDDALVLAVPTRPTDWRMR